jgi:subtilisin family serine protease
MKSSRVLLLLCALVISGALIGFLLSQRSVNHDEAEDSRPLAESLPTPAEAVVDFPETTEWTPVEAMIDYPANAIRGELLLHFTSRQDYLAYLKAMAAVGLRPLGQIDELLVLRVGSDAISGPSPRDYEAGLSFSYPVERPLPPLELSPEAMASLQGFGQSARSIVGGPVDGDGSGVIVGILDSGIQAHSQFDDVNIVRIDLTGGGVSGKGAAHGTSVASIIAGSEGIAPEAELLVVRVLDDKGVGSSYHVAEGIVQAVDLGVKVINLSLGVYQDTPLLRQAVRYADERGVILVASAGNDGFDKISYPAAYPEVLAVTAVDASGRQALFPNQSIGIDFAAPGVSVLTAKEDEGAVLFSGTSAAAPFISGTLAAMLSADPLRSSKQTVELLKRYLNDAGAPGEDPVYGDGLIDWDRLRERDMSEVLDIALADIYLSPDALPGTTMPIEVTVQNRGTQWSSDAQLEVMVGDADPVRFTIGSIGPGQITSRKVYSQVPSADSDDALAIAARVLPEKISEDVRLENNLKAVYFRSKK